MGTPASMFTGQILAIPVFYAILNVLVIGAEWLVRTFAGLFLYGIDGSGGYSETSLWLSPAVYLYQKLQTSLEWAADGNVSRVYLNPDGLQGVWVFAAAGAVLAVLALAAYRRRRSEAAGDTVSVGWAKPVFKYGVAVCAALGLGQGLYFLTWGQYLSSADYSLAGVLVCMSKLNALIEKCAQAYNDYEFLAVTHSVNDFCVLEMSNFYLDIIKDRLYCEERDGLKRRSAQTALFLILDTMRTLAREVYDHIARECPDEGLICRVSRIYRDARRLRGRGPYKDHLWFSVEQPHEIWTESPCFWFELGPEGWSYGMGGRMLRSWLERPLLTVTAISRRSAAVAALVDGTIAREELIAAMGARVADHGASAPLYTPAVEKKPFTPAIPPLPGPSEIPLPGKRTEDASAGYSAPAEPQPVQQTVELPEQQTITPATETPWRIAGEVLNTYIVCEAENETVWLIDKHAAHVHCGKHCPGPGGDRCGCPGGGPEPVRNCSGGRQQDE